MNLEKKKEKERKKERNKTSGRVACTYESMGSRSARLHPLYFHHAREGEKKKKRAYRGGSRFPRRLRAGAYAPSRTGSRDRDRDLGTLLERRPYSC